MYTECYLNEIWKDITGYEERYQISNFGRVRSLDRIDAENHFRKGQIMKQKMTKGPGRGAGYMRVGLRNGKKQKEYLVHRLVATVFIPNPYKLPQINHKDGCRSNNFVWINDDGSVDFEKSNLEWCDAQYNLSYGDRGKKVSKALTGRKNTWGNKPVLCYTKDGSLICRYDSVAAASKSLNIPGTNISACCHGKQHTAGGYKWKHA